MSIVYGDSTSYVSRSDPSYIPLGMYNQANNSTKAPLRSVLLLSVAPGSQKYFSVAPDFAYRSDSVRIPNLASVPVDVTGTYDYAQTSATPADVNAGAGAGAVAIENGAPTAPSDYPTMKNYYRR